MSKFTHRRKVGVFLLTKMVWFFTKRGTYPSDTLQLQLDSAYTDLYVELQDGNGTLAMVMGEKDLPM